MSVTFHAKAVLVLSALIGCTVLDAMTTDLRAQVKELRIAVVGAPTQPLNLLFTNPLYQESVLQAYGDSYTVSINRVASTPVAAQLFVTGQIDIAMLSAPSLSNMIVQGVVEPDDIAITGAGITDGYDGHVSTFWAALGDSGITGPQDLRGKIIAINGFGTNTDAALRTILRQNRIDPNNDVEMVELAFPNMQAALEQGRVDVGLFTVPFSARVREKGNTIELFSFADAFEGPSYSTVAVVKKSTAEEKQEAIEAYLADFVRGLHWLEDEANRDKAVELASETTGLPEDLLRGFYLTEFDQGVDSDLCVEGNWLQTPLDKLVETGVLEEVADLTGLVDLSYLPDDGAACQEE